MIKPDYRGARGSNAGDDFHELWVLRQALTLLQQETHLASIAVEGLAADDESGAPKDTWDGVDCTFYYGGYHVNSADKVIVDQVKYSGAEPHRKWTVTRLVRATNRAKDNSVIGRLAKAFAELARKRPDLAASGNLVARLVSNQPLDPSVLNALSDTKRATASLRRKLQKASGLNAAEFALFAKCLEFDCGTHSRLLLEERILNRISEWTEDDARASVDHLLRFVRRAMLPEAKGKPIIRESILAQLGFSNMGALFPCPSEIRPLAKFIPRKVSQDAIEQMRHGNQRLSLHGEGGCGKTTALQEIGSLLPPRSVMVIYDCYGGGRYLDSDASRHRPQDAFLQLANDLAGQLQIPLLASRSDALDYPRVFKRRLDRASEIVDSIDPEALLVIVIDAADNAITAAESHSPPEPSFVHDIVSIGDLPKNVCFIVTTRTGRLPSLNLPRNFTLVEISGFSPHETASYVREVWNTAPDYWIEDFHHLSRGNPRVQHYALTRAGEDPASALDYLRPTGKGLAQIFREQFDLARHKGGNEQELKTLCSGLITLPRPIPLTDVAAVTNLNEAHLRDLCSDLAPGIRLRNDSMGFADEDFEQFVRMEAEQELGSLQKRIADHFLLIHPSNAYAAKHFASALFIAKRYKEILDLIQTEREPSNRIFGPTRPCGVASLG